MNKALESLRKTRLWIQQLTEGLSDEALNAIPEGFNNNIIWNMAHLVAAEQGICYVRSGLEPRMPMEFIKAYTRGTKPEGIVSSADISAIKAALTATLPQLEADLAAGVFANYKSWTTPFGIELASIEDAMQFLPFHEGIHCGYIMALKRVVAAETAPAGTLS